jgi:hypothetical protein
MAKTYTVEVTSNHINYSKKEMEEVISLGLGICASTYDLEIKVKSSTYWKKNGRNK